MIPLSEILIPYCGVFPGNLYSLGFPGGSAVKNLPASAGDASWISRLGRSPGGGNGTPTPVFLPGKSHGQRNLVDCIEAFQELHFVK